MNNEIAAIIQILSLILCVWVVISPNLPRAIIAIGLISLTALDSGSGARPEKK
jgi:hypothetical protein